MAIPKSPDSSWDLLDWVSNPIVGVNGLRSQLFSGATSTNPTRIVEHPDSVTLASDSGGLVDFVLPLHVPNNFTFEFTAAITAPRGVFQDTNAGMLSLGVQDQGGKSGLLFFDGEDDIAFIQTPPSGVAVSLGDVADAMVTGETVTFRLVVNGNTKIMDVYATVTADLPSSGHVLRGTHVAVNSDSVMDFLSIYVRGTESNPAKITIYSMGLSRKLLHTTRAAVAVVDATEAAGVGEQVVLNGLGSYDPGGGQLSYSWRMIREPAGSNISLPGMVRASVQVHGMLFTCTGAGSEGNGTRVEFTAGGEDFKLRYTKDKGDDVITVTPRVVNGSVVSTVHDLRDALLRRSAVAYNNQVSTRIVMDIVVDGGLYETLPTNITAVCFGGTWSNLPVVTFTPKITGTYEIGLTVYNGSVYSLEVVKLIEVAGVSLLTGYTPDATYLWSYLSDFWTLVKGKKELTTFWSALIQRVGAHLLDVFQALDERSISTFPSRLLRRWEPIQLREALPSSRIRWGKHVQGYEVTPHDKGPQYTDMFTCDALIGVVGVGSRLAYNGQVTTITKVQEVDGFTVFTVDKPVLSVYAVVASGQGAQAVESPEHLGVSPFVESTHTPFSDVQPPAYLDYDGKRRSIKHATASLVELEHPQEYVGVAKAHTSYNDPDGRWFVARSWGKEGDNIRIRIYRTERLIDVPAVASGSRVYFELNLLDAGVQIGDTVLLKQGGELQEFWVVGVTEGFVDISGTPTISDVLATVFVQPGQTKVVGKLIEIRSCHRLVNNKLVGEIFNNPDSPRYNAAAGGLVSFHYTIPSQWFTHAVFNTSDSNPPTPRPWAIIKYTPTHVMHIAHEITFNTPWRTCPDLPEKYADIVELVSGGLRVATAPVLGCTPDRLLIGAPVMVDGPIAQGVGQLNQSAVLTDERVDFLEAGVYLGVAVTLDTPTGVQVRYVQEIYTHHLVLSGSPQLTVDTVSYVVGAVIPSDTVASSLVHLKTVRVDESVLSIPYLQDKIVTPENLLGVQVDPTDPAKPHDPRMYEGVDYTVSDGWVTFTQLLGTEGAKGPKADAIPDRLWAEVMFYDNKDTLENNFGILVGLPKDVFHEGASDVAYLSALRGLMFVLFRGPSLTNIRIGGQVFCNLPFAEAEGLIRDVAPDFDLVNQRSRVTIQDLAAPHTMRDYYFPRHLDVESHPDNLWFVDVTGVDTLEVSGPDVDCQMGDNVIVTWRYVQPPSSDVVESYVVTEVNGRQLTVDRVLPPVEDVRIRAKAYFPGKHAKGLPLAPGDIVDQFQPLCKGVDVVDYVKSPNWFAGGQFVDNSMSPAVSKSFLEVQKYHTFQVRVDGGLLGNKGAELFTEFIKTIKPAHTEATVSIIRSVSDELDLSLALSKGTKAKLKIRDDWYTCEDPAVDPDTSGYAHQFDHYNGAAELPLQVDQSVGSLPTDWTKAFGVGTASGDTLVDELASLLDSGVQVGDMVFLWRTGGVHKIARVADVTQTTITLDSSIGGGTWGYDVGNPVGGPPDIVDAYLYGVHKYVMGEGLIGFDHVCAPEGRGWVYKGRQKLYQDRILLTGFESLVDTRLGLDVPEEGGLPHVRLQSGTGSLDGVSPSLVDERLDFLGGLDVRPGYFVYVDPEGAKEWVEISEVHTDTLVLNNVPMTVGTDVSYRVYTKIAGDRDEIANYPYLRGVFPMYDTIFAYDYLQRDNELVRNPDDVTSLKGPRPERVVLMNSRPRYSHGFYVWADTRVVDQLGGVQPYVDDPVGGPRWVWDEGVFEDTVVSGVVACKITPANPLRDPQTADKYPAPMPVKVEV